MADAPLLKIKVSPVATLRARKDDGSGQRPGTFTAKGVQDQFAANREIGAFLRTRVGILIQNHVAFGRRAAASTGRLHNASINPRNEVISKEFVGVGISSYLDGSAVKKYWRIFEEGTQGFVGTPVWIKGKFDFPSAHGDNPGIRTAKFGSRTEGGRNRPTFFVGHEIAPANIYKQVYDENKDGMAAFAIQGINRYLDRYLSREIVVAGKDFVPPDV